MGVYPQPSPGPACPTTLSGLPAGQCSGQPVGLRALGASSGHPVCLPLASCPRVFSRKRDQLYGFLDLRQANLGSPGVTEKLQWMVLTLALPWHQIKLQPDKDQTIRSSPKPEGDSETHVQVIPWEKRGLGHLTPLLQGPGWISRLTCRKKDKTLARITKSRCENESYWDRSCGF